MTEVLRFLHISDTHFGPTEDYEFWGTMPYFDSERLVGAIVALPVQPDFVIHTGDVVSFQHSEAYHRAEKVLSRISCPLYFVTGNHDDPSILNSLPLFSASRTPLLERRDSVSYHFRRSGVLFIGLDAKRIDDRDPSGLLPEDLLEAVSRLLSSTTEPFVVFTHFPPIALDAPWIDTHLLIRNGELLHRLLVAHASRCHGVFFGHIHQPLSVARDGILYYSAPSASFQFTGWPSDLESLSHNRRGIPGMNLVSLRDGTIIVKHLTVPDGAPR